MAGERKKGTEKKHQRQYSRSVFVFFFLSFFLLHFFAGGLFFTDYERCANFCNRLVTVPVRLSIDIVQTRPV